MSLRNINDLMREAIEKYLVSEPTPSSPIGQQLFTASGAFIVPEGVTSLCMVAIGRGGKSEGILTGGPGGGLAYVNNVAVTPGQTISITVDESGSKANLGGSDIVHATSAENGGTTSGKPVVGLGFPGGTGRGGSADMWGAGAGGYTSVGANARSGNGRGGGGSSPLGGSAGGNAGGNSTGVTAGGDFGGGAGSFFLEGYGWQYGEGGKGCVRLIWGPNRAFPNTNTGDM